QSVRSSVVLSSQPHSIGPQTTSQAILVLVVVGVATAFGAIAPIGLDLTGVMAGTWLLTILLSGYSSLGAIVSALIAPFYVWWFKPQYTFPVSMLSCLILLRHHDNIQRLWRRQESKIWTRVKKKKTPEEK
ncbi:glycerol-3-phosphate acyltransferase, partial [Klebsiella quasipneumoniae]